MEIEPNQVTTSQPVSKTPLRFWFRYVGFLIAAGLLTCFAASFYLAGRYFFPTWNGIYLVPIAFITAMDGMLAYHRLRYSGFPEKEWLLYRFSEWVVILVLLKTGQYWVNGTQSLARDFTYLIQREWGNLLSGEFLFSVGIMLMVWMLSGRFAELLGKLEVDEKLLKVEQESGIYELRSQARESLVSMILVLGVLMVLVVSLAGIEAPLDWRQTPALRAGVTNLLIFFFLTLCLFSLSLLNLMSTIWVREGLTIRPDLVRNWLMTSIAMILLLAFIASLLPTRYAVNLLTILNYLATSLVAIISYLIFLISAPIFMVVAFLASLFQFSSMESLSQPEPVLDLPPPPVEATAAPWLELLKSILFWVVLIGMLIFAISYYLHENRAIWSGLKRIALFKKLENLWSWFTGRWRMTNRIVQDKLQQGWQTFLARLQNEAQVQIPARLNLRRLSDREKVFFYYLAMLKRGAEKGPARQPWQTPYEYLQDLETRYQLDGSFLQETGINQGEANVAQTEELTEASIMADSELLHDARELTEYFMQARYSLQPVTRQDASLVKQIWDRLRKALRRPKK